MSSRFSSTVLPRPRRSLSRDAGSSGVSTCGGGHAARVRGCSSTARVSGAEASARVGHAPPPCVSPRRAQRRIRAHRSTHARVAAQARVWRRAVKAGAHRQLVHARRQDFAQVAVQVAHRRRVVAADGNHHAGSDHKVLWQHKLQRLRGRCRRRGVRRRARRRHCDGGGRTRRHAAPPPRTRRLRRRAAAAAAAGGHMCMHCTRSCRPAGCAARRRSRPAAQRRAAWARAQRRLQRRHGAPEGRGEQIARCVSRRSAPSEGGVKRACRGGGAGEDWRRKHGTSLLFPHSRWP
jgi:hypothetical protein